MAKSDSKEEKSSKGLDEPLKKPLTFDHLKSKKKPNYKDQIILLDPSKGNAVDEVKEKLAAVEKKIFLKDSIKTPGPSVKSDIKALNKELESLKEDLEAAEEAMYEASALFRFKSIGRNSMDELLAENSPSPRQIEEAKVEGNNDLQYNPETFPQALIAASCVEPDMSVEDVQELWDDEDWTTPELLSLFTAAQEVNQDFRLLDPKKGYGLT